MLQLKSIMSRVIRYEDYSAWEAETIKQDNADFKTMLDESRAKKAEQPLATFYDGLNYVERRSMDTYNDGSKKQRIFENRSMIIGDDVADFSLAGVLAEKRPALARNFDDEN